MIFTEQFCHTCDAARPQAPCVSNQHTIETFEYERDLDKHPVSGHAVATLENSTTPLAGILDANLDDKCHQLMSSSVPIWPPVQGYLTYPDGKNIPGMLHDTTDRDRPRVWYNPDRPLAHPDLVAELVNKVKTDAGMRYLITDATFLFGALKAVAAFSTTGRYRNAVTRGSKIYLHALHEPNRTLNNFTRFWPKYVPFACQDAETDDRRKEILNALDTVWPALAGQTLRTVDVTSTSMPWRYGDQAEGFVNSPSRERIQPATVHRRLVLEDRTIHVLLDSHIVPDQVSNLSHGVTWSESEKVVAKIREQQHAFRAESMAIAGLVLYHNALGPKDAKNVFLRINTGHVDDEAAVRAVREAMVVELPESVVDVDAPPGVKYGSMVMHRGFLPVHLHPQSNIDRWYDAMSIDPDEDDAMLFPLDVQTKCYHIPCTAVWEMPFNTQLEQKVERMHVLHRAMCLIKAVFDRLGIDPALKTAQKGGSFLLREGHVPGTARGGHFTDTLKYFNTYYDAGKQVGAIKAVLPMVEFATFDDVVEHGNFDTTNVVLRFLGPHGGKSPSTAIWYMCSTCPHIAPNTRRPMVDQHFDRRNPCGGKLMAVRIDTRDETHDRVNSVSLKEFVNGRLPIGKNGEDTMDTGAEVIDVHRPQDSTFLPSRKSYFDGLPAEVKMAHVRSMKVPDVPFDIAFRHWLSLFFGEDAPVSCRGIFFNKEDKRYYYAKYEDMATRTLGVGDKKSFDELVAMLRKAYVFSLKHMHGAILQLPSINNNEAWYTTKMIEGVLKEKRKSSGRDDHPILPRREALTPEHGKGR